MGLVKSLLPFLVLVAPARAGTDGGLTFDWTAPADCPSAVEIETEIGGLLGGDLRERVPFSLSVHAVVEHHERWSVSLDTTSPGGQGHRTFQAETCKALASATALIVALMIDPDAVAAHAEEPARPPLAVSPSPAPAPSSPKAPVIGFVGLDGWGELGVVPTADVAVGASTGIAGAWWRLEVRAGYGPRAVASDRVGSGGLYGRFRLISGVLAACLLRSGSKIGGGVCANVETGALLAEGVGAARNESHTRPWLGAGAGVMGDVRLTPTFFVVVHVDAIAPLLRPNYTFNNLDASVFRPWPVGFRLAAALEWRF